MTEDELALFLPLSPLRPGDEIHYLICINLFVYPRIFIASQWCDHHQEELEGKFEVHSLTPGDTNWPL